MTPPHPAFGAMDSWWLLHEGESVFFKVMTSGKTTHSSGWPHTQKYMNNTNWSQMGYYIQSKKEDIKCGGYGKVGGMSGGVNIIKIHCVEFLTDKIFLNEMKRMCALGKVTHGKCIWLGCSSVIETLASIDEALVANPLCRK